MASQPRALCRHRLAVDVVNVELPNAAPFQQHSIFGDDLHLKAVNPLLIAELSNHRVGRNDGIAGNGGLSARTPYAPGSFSLGWSNINYGV
jgi:hypothetical protein